MSDKRKSRRDLLRFLSPSSEAPASEKPPAQPDTGVQGLIAQPITRRTMMQAAAAASQALPASAAAPAANTALPTYFQHPLLTTLQSAGLNGTVIGDGDFGTFEEYLANGARFLGIPTSSKTEVEDYSSMALSEIQNFHKALDCWFTPVPEELLADCDPDPLHGIGEMRRILINYILKLDHSHVRIGYRTYGDALKNPPQPKDPEEVERKTYRALQATGHLPKDHPFNEEEMQDITTHADLIAMHEQAMPTRYSQRNSNGNRKILFQDMVHSFLHKSMEGMWAEAQDLPQQVRQKALLKTADWLSYITHEINVLYPETDPYYAFRPRFEPYQHPFFSECRLEPTVPDVFKGNERKRFLARYEQTTRLLEGLGEQSYDSFEKFENVVRLEEKSKQKLLESERKHVLKQKRQFRSQKVQQALLDQEAGTDNWTDRSKGKRPPRDGREV